MITEIKINYPSRTMNLGEKIDQRSATITFEVGLGKTTDELSYKKVSLNGVSQKFWTRDDIEFIQSVTSKIIELDGKKFEGIIK